MTRQIAERVRRRTQKGLIINFAEVSVHTG